MLEQVSQRLRAWLGVALLLAPGGLTRHLRADTSLLAPVADTTLMEVAPDRNNGGQAWFIGGTTQNGMRARGLIQFDIAGLIPAQALITNVTLTLEVTRQPADGYAPSTFGLHRVLQPWGEGNKVAIDNNGGHGAPATDGEATWSHRLYSTAPWAAPGGLPGVDFAIEPSAGVFVQGTGESPYVFSSTADLITDVEFWRDHPEANFGWMLVSDAEDVPFTARQFGSRNGGFPPALSVDFVPVPEPATWALWAAGLAGLCGRGWRRRSGICSIPSGRE